MPKALVRKRLSVSPPLGLTSNSRSEEHTSELQSRLHLVCRLLLEKKKGHSVGVAQIRTAPGLLVLAPPAVCAVAGARDAAAVCQCCGGGRASRGGARPAPRAGLPP